MHVGRRDPGHAAHPPAVKDSTVHRCLMGVWLVLLVPTIVWWRSSVVWLVFMSWYANFVGHWSTRAAMAAKEEAAT